MNKPDTTEGMELLQIKTLEDENVAEFETIEQFWTVNDPVPQQIGQGLCCKQLERIPAVVTIPAEIVDVSQTVADCVGNTISNASTEEFLKIVAPKHVIILNPETEPFWIVIHESLRRIK